jgi:uncharacterized protein
MFIDLTALETRQKEKLEIDHCYAAEELPLNDSDLQFQRPCQVAMVVARRGRDLQAQGKVTAQLQVPCDRCLELINIDIDSDFSLIYLPVEQLSPADELALERQELDFVFYENHQLNLDELVTEQLHLAVPMSKLCQEACRGLCAGCGQNLNQDKCQCTDAPIDPRWQALMDLKKNLK